MGWFVPETVDDSPGMHNKNLENLNPAFKCQS